MAGISTSDKASLDGSPEVPRLRRPTTRNEFEVAIICALTIEADAVKAVFDTHWDVDGFSYGRAAGDVNAYSAGAVGCHNVVLVHMPGVGKVNAAAAAASCRASFPGIKLAVVVGICGAVPFTSNGDEVLLGDVIISDGLIQYDLGRRLPDRFVRKSMVPDSLSRPNPEISALLSKLKGIQVRRMLQDRIVEYLGELHAEPSLQAEYPGKAHDVLFDAAYSHIVEGAPCDECGCDGQLVPRDRLTQTIQRPFVHFGLIASGDTVMKSGTDRDSIARRENVVGFEMEGAGVWDTFPCIVIKGACDYADSHKIKLWQRYATGTAAACMKAVLCHWVPSSRRKDEVVDVNSSAEKLLQQKQRSILRRLYPFRSKYEQQKDRNPERLAGTCKWFVNHQLFQHWKKKKGSAFLWVSADPGCGKSVLVKYLVDKVLTSSEARTTCYFFFKDDFDDQKQIVGALRCILYQLFCQKPALLSPNILTDFEEDTDEVLNNFYSLWSILTKVANNESTGEIICILDALDECEEKGQSELAKALERLYTTRSSRSSLKFLVASRPYAQIQWKFQTLEERDPTIHLNGENEEEIQSISREIDIVIHARLNQLAVKIGLSDGDKQMWLKELLKIDNRTYLWVYLVFEVIENDTTTFTKEDIRQYIRNLPETVEAAYEKILSKSPHVDRAKKLLHIVVAANRPLYLQEIAVALAITENHRSCERLNEELLSLDRLRRNIREACGLFVVIQDLRIYLLHQTAREFLIQSTSPESINNLRPALQWQYSLHPMESQKVLSEICIWYLLLEDFPKPSSDVILNEIHSKYGFLKYAAQNWTSHFRLAQTKTSQNTLLLASRLCDTNFPICSIWFQIYWESSPLGFPNGFNSLTIASYFGLEDVVAILLNAKDINPSSKDTTYKRSPLSWASENGFYGVVRLLVQQVPKYKVVLRDWSSMMSTVINCKDTSHRTPLWYAAANGHKEIAELLINKGANINCKDEYGLTPLMWALYGNHKATIDLLVAKGAKNQSNSKSDAGNRLLMRAASEGNDAVVRMMLEKGASVECKNTEGNTPLLLSTLKGHETLVQILVDEGANVTAINNTGEMPLLLAASDGQEGILKIFLDNGADPDAKNNYGQTPLASAAFAGHKTIIQMLLDKGANLEAKNYHSETPLASAAIAGHKAIVQMFLDKRANLQTRNNYGRPLLALAALEGHEAIVQILLDKGAYIEERDNDSNTALTLAALKGHEAIVQMLLDKGANPNVYNRISNKSLLASVSSQGYKAIIQMLLDQGAKIEAKDDFGKTPLMLAIIQGHEAVVQMLLDRGANIESKDGSGRTPLILAILHGHEGIVQMLLDRGANTEVEDGTSGKSPLALATFNNKFNNVAIVQMLLNERAKAKTYDGVKGLHGA